MTPYPSSLTFDHCVISLVDSSLFVHFSNLWPLCKLHVCASFGNWLYQSISPLVHTRFALSDLLSGIRRSVSLPVCLSVYQSVFICLTLSNFLRLSSYWFFTIFNKEENSGEDDQTREKLFSGTSFFFTPNYAWWEEASLALMKLFFLLASFLLNFVYAGFLLKKGMWR